MKALNRGAPVMILDEPTAALSNTAKWMLFELVKALQAAGISFIYISHHLDEVFEVADTVTILRDGLVVKAREPVANLDVEMIADLMMGEKTARSVREDDTRPDAAPLLQAKAIRVPPKHDHGIDFQIHPGEIVALAGPVGGGREALATMLAGQLTPTRGKITEQGGRLPTIGLVSLPTAMPAAMSASLGCART
jgi:ABC-type sugar transport system ATPase subunit